jgi:glycine oxidase
MPHGTPDVAVVGGGPIGLSIAYRAQQRGATVVVLDAGGDGAYRHAAGMLAPVTEAHPGEDPLVRMSLDSHALWPAFADELGLPLNRAGTLAVARDRDDAEALDRLHAYRTRLGLASERLLPSKARRVEPALAPTVRLALDVATDWSVDPMELVAALRARVPVRHEEVTSLPDVRAGKVVLAAGVWSARLLDLPLRPVRGQVVRLRGPKLVERTIRTLDTYLVPRGDGRYVLGATMEERGWETAPTAGGVFELIRDMSEVVPGILELDVERVSVGLRPATPDNLPLLEERDGVLVCTGHFRNGILLAPLAAELCAARLEKAVVA